MPSFSRPATGLLAAAAAVCCAGLVAACSSAGGSTPPSAAGKPGSSSAPSAGQPSSGSGSGSGSGGSPSTTTGEAGPSACATSILRGSVPAIGDAASGHYYYPLNLTNDSNAKCTLYGYPGVSFVTSADGSQIGAAATRDTPGQLGDQPAQAVTLAPGQTAHAVLELLTAGVYSPSACGLVTAHWLRVYPPGQTAPLYIGFSAQTCAKGQDLLTVSPVQPVGSANP
jgi:hypothetical protein